MNSDFLQLIPASICIVFATYGTWFLLVEIFMSFVPLTLLSAGVILVIIVIFRIPPPDRLAVESIIGKDLNQEGGENGLTIKSIAHRGAGLDAPENSLEAFTKCQQKGCNVIEFDVNLTSDGVPIVFHDYNTERMSDSNLVVRNSTWEELSKVNISTKHAFRDAFPDVHIPTLNQAVEHMLSLGQRMFIDIKEPNTKMVPVILKLFRKYPDLQSKAVVTTFFPNLVYMIRRKNPEIVCCLAWRPKIFTDSLIKRNEYCSTNGIVFAFKKIFTMVFDAVYDWALPRIIYYVLGISVILLHKDCISKQIINKWNSLGVRVMAWTVNSPIEKQYMSRILQISYFTDTLTAENTIHNI